MRTYQIRLRGFFSKMSKCVLNTKFSKYGLFAVVLVFFPYLIAWFPRKNFLLQEMYLTPRWLFALYIISAIALSATLILIDNNSALSFSRHSRMISLAFILLGIYYILWVYYLIGKSSFVTLFFFKLLSSGAFLCFSFDRKNWVSFGFSLVFMALGIVLSAMALCA